MESTEHSRLLKFLVTDTNKMLPIHKIEIEYIQPTTINSEVPGEQKLREPDIETNGNPEISKDEIDITEFAPVMKFTKIESTFTKDDLKYQKTTVTEDISNGENEKNGVMKNPEYSKVHSDTIPRSQMRNGSQKDEKLGSEDKKPQTRIPTLKFKQAISKVKRERKNSEDRKASENQNQKRRSSIPKLKKKTKVKHLYEEKGRSETEEEEFDKIYEQIVDNQPTNIVLDDVAKIEDPDKIESKFEEIIHAYDENKIQPITVEKPKHSKIPLIKRKSEQEIEIPKQVEKIESHKVSTDKTKNSNARASNIRDTKIKLPNKIPVRDDKANSIRTNPGIIIVPQIENKSEASSTVPIVKETVKVVTPVFPSKEEIEKNYDKQINNDFGITQENEKPETEANETKSGLLKETLISESVVIKHSFDTGINRPEDIILIDNYVEHQLVNEVEDKDSDLKVEISVETEAKPLIIETNTNPELSKAELAVTENNNIIIEKLEEVSTNNTETVPKKDMKEMFNDIKKEIIEKDIDEEDIPMIRGKVSRLLSKIETKGIVHDETKKETNDIPKQKSVLNKIAMFEKNDVNEIIPKSIIPRSEPKIHKPPSTSQLENQDFKPKIVNQLLKASIPIENAAQTELIKDITVTDQVKLPEIPKDGTVIYEKVIIDATPKAAMRNFTKDVSVAVTDTTNDNEKLENIAKENDDNQIKVIEFPLQIPEETNSLQYTTTQENLSQNTEESKKTNVNKEFIFETRDIKTQRSIVEREFPNSRRPVLNTMSNIETNDLTKRNKLTDRLKVLVDKNKYDKFEDDGMIHKNRTKSVNNTLKFDKDNYNLPNKEIKESVPPSVQTDTLNIELNKNNTVDNPILDKELNNNLSKKELTSTNEYVSKRIENNVDIANKEVCNKISHTANRLMSQDEDFNIRKAKSVAELDLGDSVKGKVRQMIVRMNSIEKIELDKKEVKISIKERPRKRSVSEKIALFERKLTPIRMESTQANVVSTPEPKPAPVSDEKYQERLEELASAKSKYGSVTDMNYLVLRNGLKMPVLAVGTALLDPSLTVPIVSAAIDLGYRAIDTAYIYGTEKEVGEAIRNKIEDGTVVREDLFIISKLWSTYHRKDLVEPACRASLQAMGLDYFDLFLIHNPISLKEGGEPLPKIANVIQFSEHDYMDAWYGMEDLVKKGLVKSIGVSNFNSTQVARVVERGKVKPSVNQVECHPYLSQQRLDEFCGERDVKLSCFGVLGSKGTPAELKSSDTAVIDDPLVKVLAAGLGITPAQLLIRYQIDAGHNVVVKASSGAHLWNNLQALRTSLSPAEVQALSALNRNKRTFTFKGMGETHKNYPFLAPF